MSSDFNMKDPQKIHNSFKPILEGLKNSTEEEKKATQIALESLSNTIRETPSLPLESIQAIQDNLIQLRLLSPNDTTLQGIADRILGTITPIPSSSSSATQSPARPPSSPRFILNASIYQNNKALSPTYYEEHVEKAISEAAIHLINTRNQNNNAAIPSIFQNLALRRKEIALNQKSDYAENFGVERHLFNGNLITALLPNGPYDEYEQKFLNSLSFLCQAHKEELTQKKSFEILSQATQNIPSKFSCNLIYKETLTSSIRGRCLPLELESTVTNLIFVLQNILNKPSEKFEDILSLLNEPHIGLIHTITSVTVNNESCPLTEFFFFFHKDDLEKHPPQFTKTRAHLTLHHSHPYYGKKLEEYINKKQIPLCLASKTLPELKENIGVFLYLSAQATLYKRGSASIAEMQAKAICEAFGFKMEYGKDFSTEGKRPLADLDALTSITSDEFMVDFLSKIELTRLA